MFIPTNTIKIGDKCITTKELENFAGKFTVGTVVKVTGFGDRGYNLVDDFGNEIIECGWNCVKKVESKSIKWGEISENGQAKILRLEEELKAYRKEKDRLEKVVESNQKTLSRYEKEIQGLKKRVRESEGYCPTDFS